MKKKVVMIVISMLLLGVCIGCAGSNSTTNTNVKSADTDAETEEITEEAMKEVTEETEKTDTVQETFTGNNGIEFGVGETVDKGIWTQTTIYPNNIDDTFVIDICLPDDYDESVSYPAMYLTDCYWRREDYASIKELYESGKTKEFILVGIGYPDDYDFDLIRERDLLEDPNSFLDLIVNGVLPYAESNYNIDAADRTFCGASYGGYFTLYSLFQSDGITKDVFKNYVLASAAFYEKSYKKNLAGWEEEYYERGNTELNANVYMSVGADEEGRFLKPFNKFVSLMEERNYSGLNLTSKIYEGKEHYTVWVPTLLDGLQMFLKK